MRPADAPREAASSLARLRRADLLESSRSATSALQSATALSNWACWTASSFLSADECLVLAADRFKEAMSASTSALMRMRSDSSFLTASPLPRIEEAMSRSRAAAAESRSASSLARLDVCSEARVLKLCSRLVVRSFGAPDQSWIRVRMQSANLLNQRRDLLVLGRFVRGLDRARSLHERHLHRAACS